MNVWGEEQEEEKQLCFSVVVSEVRDVEGNMCDWMNNLPYPKQSRNTTSRISPHLCLDGGTNEGQESFNGILRLLLGLSKVSSTDASVVLHLQDKTQE